MQRKGDIKKYKVSVKLSLIAVVLVESKLAEVKVGLPCTHRLSVIVLLFDTISGLCPIEYYLLPVFCSLRSWTEFGHLHSASRWTRQNRRFAYKLIESK